MLGLLTDLDGVGWIGHHMDESGKDGSRRYLVEDSRLLLDLRNRGFRVSLVIFVHDE